MILAQRDIPLFSSGRISGDPKDNVLTVKTGDGRLIGSRQLHGSRDLLKYQAGHGCRDAALVQAWLARVPDTEKNDGTMVYRNMTRVGKGKTATTAMSIDGIWNSACIQSLKRFQKQYAPGISDFPALVAGLRGAVAMIQ